MPDEAYYDAESGNSDLQPRSQRQQHHKFCQRTILLANLPDGATHAEVVNVIRGGMLLDIYLRSHDRTASVSFLEEIAAQEFFRHVKRHDLYIRGKRVSNDQHCYVGRINFNRLIFVGMIVNLFYQDMLQIRSISVPQEI